MRNNCQFILFMESSVTFNPSLMAFKITESFKEIGQPILLPTTNFPIEASAPVLIFNGNPNFQIIINHTSVTINISEEYYSQLKTIIKDIIAILTEVNLNLWRIGYIKNILLSPSKKMKFIQNNFSQITQEELQDIQYGWCQTITLNSINVNCWERYLTDSQLLENLLVTFDINTLANKKENITIEFIERYIDAANDYIDNRIESGD